MPAQKIKMKMRTPLARSFAVHLVLVVLMAVVVYLEPKPLTDEPIQIESISLKKEVKRAFYKAIHTMGIPHEENPVEESTESKSDTSPPQNLNASDAINEEGGGIAPSEMQKYIAEIVSRINRTKQYPKEAMFNEQEGLVEVLIVLTPDGKITHSSITKATPFRSLNDAAMQAIQKLGMLPPLPNLPNGSPITSTVKLHIPIHFQLK